MILSHKMYSGDLRPIPGYEGVYSITPYGVVVNRHNHVMKPFATPQGEAIELRNNGQRERILIKDLLERLGE